MTPAQLVVAKHLLAAEAGVEYRPGRGAYCPACGAKLRTVNTLPWTEGFRTRYHKCAAPDCILAKMGKNIKSVQTEKS